jgi:hypothetical protein
MTAILEAPFFPIIYVRGYAGNQSEVEETVADPYMGFNLGSSKLRQLWTGKCEQYFFESPVLRLMKDFDYKDVYSEGSVMPEELPVTARSIFIYRYYDRSSAELGDGSRLSIEEAAAELGSLILRIRKRLSGDDDAARQAFRVYLVAHSMGGLVCRCLLQNVNLKHPSDPSARLDEARGAVDKVFTYATPHNGIDLNVIGNVPGFVSLNDANNFDRDRMREFLGLPDKKSSGADRVDNLNDQFDPDRFFNLVGTNHSDYGVLKGLVRNRVGPMSDGLVRIANATTWGTVPNSGTQAKRNSPRAFVHRSHSGHYGIVNSEEGYQNLIRFLFGDVRVDGVLHVESLILPPDVQKAQDAGKAIRASYHFEVVLRVRGALWDLHRRTKDDNSAIFRKFDELLPNPDSGAPARHPQLFSTFLSKSARVDTKRPGLGFSIDLRAFVPLYEIDNRFWLKDHLEGGYLFHDKINIEAVPPRSDDEPWSIRYGFDRKTPNRMPTTTKGEWTSSGMQFSIPIEQKTRPGIRAQLLITVQPRSKKL